MNIVHPKFGSVEIVRVIPSSVPRDGVTDELQGATAVVALETGELRKVPLVDLAVDGLSVVDLVFMKESESSSEADRPESVPLMYHERYGLVRVLNRVPQANWFNELVEVEPVVPGVAEFRGDEWYDPDWSTDEKVVPTRQALYVHPSELTPPPLFDHLFQDGDLYVATVDYEEDTESSWHLATPVPRYEEFYRLVCVMPNGMALLAGEESQALRLVPVVGLLNVRTGLPPAFDVHHFLYIRRRGKGLWQRKVTLSEASIVAERVTWKWDGDRFVAVFSFTMNGRRAAFKVATKDGAIFSYARQRGAELSPLALAALIQYAAVSFWGPRLKERFTNSVARMS